MAKPSKPMHVQVIGGEHMRLVDVLCRAGVHVSLVETDPHDRARLQDMTSRRKMPGALCIRPAAAENADLVLGAGKDVVDAVSLGWSDGGPSIHIAGLPGSPLLVEQVGEDPTSGQLQRLAQVLGGEHITLPSGYLPVSARLAAALGRALEQLMLLGAAPAEIDAALVACGWTLGPAEAQDLIGVDTALASRHRLHRHLGVSDDLPLFPRAVAEGRLGRKVGVGWYRYPGNGGKVEDPLVEDMAAEEARFAGIEQSFPTASRIADAVSEAVTKARATMPDIPDSDINTVLHLAIGAPGLTRDRL